MLAWITDAVMAAALHLFDPCSTQQGMTPVVLALC